MGWPSSSITYWVTSTRKLIGRTPLRRRRSAIQAGVGTVAFDAVDHATDESRHARAGLQLDRQRGIAARRNGRHVERADLAAHAQPPRRRRCRAR